MINQLPRRERIFSNITVNRTSNEITTQPKPIPYNEIDFNLHQINLSIQKRTRLTTNFHRLQRHNPDSCTMRPMLHFTKLYANQFPWDKKVLCFNIRQD